MPPEHELLNTKMAKPRVISEHVNGILKNRFPILNSLPFVLKGRKSLQKIIRYIDACIILHNLLVGIKEDVPIEWMEDIEVLSDIDGCDSDDELNRAIPENQTPDTRRTQLMLYLNELAG
jgi:hypothetical protein